MHSDGPERRLFPDLSRPLRFPRDILWVLYWAYCRPRTLDDYIKQRVPSLSATTPLPRLMYRGRRNTDVRHLLYLLLFHVLVTSWLLYFVGKLLVSGEFIQAEDVFLLLLLSVWIALLGGAVRGLSWALLGSASSGLFLTLLYLPVKAPFPSVVDGIWAGILGSAWGSTFTSPLWGFVWIELSFLAMAATSAFGSMIGDELLYTLVVGVWVGFLFSIGYVIAKFPYLLGGILIGVVRFHEYPFLALWAWLLALLDRQGRWIRFSPPFWYENLVLPLPGIERHVRNLARQDRILARAAVDALSKHPSPWVRRLVGRLSMHLETPVEWRT